MVLLRAEYCAFAAVFVSYVAETLDVMLVAV